MTNPDQEFKHKLNLSVLRNVRTLTVIETTEETTVDPEVIHTKRYWDMDGTHLATNVRSIGIKGSHGPS